MLLINPWNHAGICVTVGSAGTVIFSASRRRYDAVASPSSSSAADPVILRRDVGRPLGVLSGDRGPNSFLGGDFGPGERLSDGVRLPPAVD